MWPLFYPGLKKANCIHCGSIPKICIGDLLCTKHRRTKAEPSVGLGNNTAQNGLEGSRGGRLARGPDGSGREAVPPGKEAVGWKHAES